MRATRRLVPSVLLIGGLVGLGAQARHDAAVPFSAAGPDASPTIAALRARVETGEVGALPTFWEEVQKKGTPLIEPFAGDRRYSLVTFLWRGSEQTHDAVVVDGVAVAVGGVDPRNSEMTHLGTTDVWYRSYQVRNDARFVYKLSENDSLQSFVDPDRKSPKVVADPLNPHLFPTGQSFVELPEAPAQELVARSPLRMGEVRQEVFHSALLNNDRRLWVYTPPGFDATRGEYPLAIVFDGLGYTQWVPVPHILDNLIADGRIRPMVAVMVGGAAGDRDTMCTAPFADFVATELVPWMRERVRATRAARRTVIAGSSVGGLTATCAALRHPEVFGNVLSQSGSYWWAPAGDPAAEWVKRQMTTAARLPLRFYMEVGLMEISDQLNTNRALHEVLRTRGYDVTYREFNGNHTYLQWRGSFGSALEALRPDR